MADITFNAINTKLGGVTTARETALKTTLDAMDENPTTAQMLKMQHEIQQWSILTQIQSTITKELSDTLKGVIQKAA